MYKKLAVWRIAAIASLGGLLFGFNTAILSGAVFFIKKEFHLSITSESTLFSAILFGAFLGALASIRLVDIVGRRKLLLASAAIFIVGSFWSGSASAVVHLLSSRFLIGIAIGICSLAVPLYITEIAPTNIRGALVGMNQLFVTLGILLAYLVDYYNTSCGHWRIMLMFGLVPAIVFLLGATLLPESPRWLLQHGWYNRARKALKQLVPDGNFEAEFMILQSRIKRSGNLRNLLKHWLWPVIIVVFGLSIIQQVSGINIIFYYGPDFLRSIGMHTSKAIMLISVIIGFINVCGSVTSMLLVDRIGRRKLLITSLILMAMANLFVAFSFHYFLSIKIREIFSITAMIVGVSGFAIGLGPLVWLMMCELFPTIIRGLAVSLAAATNWLANMLVIFSFLPMAHFIGNFYCFLIYGLLSLAGIFFVYKLVPETAKISLEKIESRLRTTITHHLEY
ncbi:MAG: sugar porter family MFS transporter [Gammaproteobacteria bacterium]|nr:sugar porter family MFS transporter [Gammaproteobacteria bacterium]